MGVTWATWGACRLVAFAAALAAVVGLVGCGGSSSSDERAKLSKQVSAQLQASTAPPEVSSCVSQQARGLPLDQLRALANAGADPSPAVKQEAVHLLVVCLSQGKGAAAVRAVMANTISQAMPSDLPASYRNCVIAKANGIPSSQLAQLAAEFATGNTAAAQAQSHKFGISFGLQCLGTPAVLASFRAIIKRSFASSHASVAFQNCVLGKLGGLSAYLLKQPGLELPGVPAAVQAFGRKAESACEAGGIKP